MVLGPRSGRIKTVGDHKFDSGGFRVGVESDGGGFRVGAEFLV